MTIGVGRERPSGEGIVSGFVTAEVVRILDEAINQAAVAALASDLLAFWPPAKPPFVLALFEDRVALSEGVPRLSGMAAAGATVVVGAPSKMHTLPAELYGVDLRGTEDLADARALIVLEGAFAAALVAVPSEIADGPAYDRDGNELFHARWTFRRSRVVDAANQLIRPLRPILAPALVAAADVAIQRAAEVPVSDAEKHLSSVLEAVGSALVHAPLLVPVPADRDDKDEKSEKPKRPEVVRD